MRGWPLVFLAAVMAAQTAPSGGVVQGTVLEWERRPAGALTVRANDNRVICFQFDGKTFVEQNGKRIAMTGFDPGQAVEVIWEEGAKPRQPYALVVRLVPAAPSAAPLVPRDPAPRAYRELWNSSSPLDDLFPRGNLTFAGRVRELAADRLVLAGKHGEDIAVQLRPDTRYFYGGSQVAPASLRVNSTVFVRGGKSFEGGIEAYQVVWGDILRPD
jgi:hypothetical protein